MKVPEPILTEIKQHERLPEVLAELLPDVKPDGSSGRSIATVPWREDKHPSLSLFRGTDGVLRFKDLACGDSGDCIELVHRISGYDFRQAVKWLSGRLGIGLPDESTSKTAQNPATNPTDLLTALETLYELAKPLDDGTTPAAYLHGRGLLSAARDLGVRGLEPGEPREIVPDANNSGLWTPARWVREGHGFLVYPAVVDSRTVAHRCRLLMSQREAESLELGSAHWNPPTRDGLQPPTFWPTLPESVPTELTLCEGEADCLALRMLIAGINAYAIMGTSRFNVNTAEFKRIVAAKPSVTLAFQRDQASTKAAKRISDLLNRYAVKSCAIVPAGGAEDWCQLIEWDQGGVSSLDVISAPLGIYSVSQTFDVLTKHLDDMAAGRIQLVPVPWPTLAWAFNENGIPPKTIGLLSSKTGVGKTWCTYQLALFAAGFRQSDGRPVFILNTEMAENAIAARLLALAAGDASVVTMADPDRVKELQFEHQSALDRLPLEITPPQPRSTSDVIDLLAEKAKTHKLLIVDHIGDLDYKGKSWEILPRFALALRDLARRTGIVVLLVTHLKMGEQGLDVLAYSRQVENVVDWSLSLQGFEAVPARISTACGTVEEMIDRTMTIRKNRFGKSGLRIAMCFDENTLALSDKGRLVSMANAKRP